MPLTISILPAGHGDAIVIQVDSWANAPFRILVDGGPSDCFQRVQGWKRTSGPLKEVLDTFVNRQEKFDLVVMTHVDDDHIGGLLKACEHDSYQAVIGKKVWFNSGKLIAQDLGGGEVPDGSDAMVKTNSGKLTSIAQGVTFDQRLHDWQITQRHLRIAGQKIPFSHGQITILSPTEAQLRALLSKWEREKPSSLTSATSTDYASSMIELQANDSFVEDKSIHNASSIAFLIESGESKALFLGDALPSTICNTLRDLGYSEENPLKVGACKLAHHGSKANTNSELLSLIKCDRFIISTNGLKHGLPNKTTLARIRAVSPESEILFNYAGLKEKIFSPGELKEAESVLKNIQGDIVL